MSFSSLTYASQGGKITSIASTSDSHIVSGSDNGTVHAAHAGRKYTYLRRAARLAKKTVPDSTGAAEIRHVNKSEAPNAVDIPERTHGVLHHAGRRRVRLGLLVTRVAKLHAVILPASRRRRRVGHERLGIVVRHRYRERIHQFT